MFLILFLLQIDLYLVISPQKIRGQTKILPSALLVIFMSYDLQQLSHFNLVPIYIPYGAPFFFKDLAFLC